MVLKTTIDPIDVQQIIDNHYTFPCLQLDKNEAVELANAMEQFAEAEDFGFGEDAEVAEQIISLLDETASTINKDGDVKYILLRIHN